MKNLPPWLQHFLFWYLGGYTRLNRRWFGGLMALGLAPGLVVMLVSLFHTAQNAQQRWSPMMHDVGRVMGEATSGQAVDAASAQASVEQFLSVLQPDTFPWSHVLTLVGFVFLFPIVQMWLRDMGKTHTALHMWSAAVYAGPVVEALALLGLSLGMLGGVAKFVAFVALIWVSLASGKADTRLASKQYEKSIGFKP